MATTKAKEDKASASKITRGKKTFVGVGSDLRSKYPWIDAISKDVIDAANEKRRKDLRKGKPKLSGSRLAQVATIHDRLQREINRLSSRQSRLTDRLAAHYGHTGIQEFESTEGRKTLVSTSISLAVDPDDLVLRIGKERFNALVKPMLDPERMLEEAGNDEVLKLAITGAMRVSKYVVSVTAPSSRRGKSGNPEGE